jgi:hypothetical protein
MFDKQVGELFAKARAAQKRHNVASARDVGRLMRLFDATLDALTTARADGVDAIEAVDQAVGWARLLEARPQVEALAASADPDPLVGAAAKYMTLRRFGPAFLEAFRFRAAGGRDGAFAAVKLLQDLNRSGRRMYRLMLRSRFPVAGRPSSARAKTSTGGSTRLRPSPRFVTASALATSGSMARTATAGSTPISSRAPRSRPPP